MEYLFLSRIEALRQKMYSVCEEKGMYHPDVLAVSQRLDKALNDFNKFKYRSLMIIDNRLESGSFHVTIFVEYSKDNL